MRTQKKKHVGLTIFLIILAILILIPAAFYVYLSGDPFHVRMRAIDLAAEAPYAGKTSLTADGLTEIPMDSSDLAWFFRENGGSDAFAETATLEAAAVECNPERLTVDVLAKAMGILPMPIRVELGVLTGDTGVDVTIQEVRLGKWIKIPMKLLSRFGVEESYFIQYSDMIEGVDVRALRLEKDTLVLTVSFLDNMVQETWGSSELAETLLLYGVQSDEVLEAAAAIHQTTMWESCAIYAQTLQTMDQAELPRLFAMMNPQKAKTFLSGLNPFEKRYLLSVTPEAVTAAEEQMKNETIVPMNRRLTAVLDALREKYKALEVRVSRDGFVEAQTGETLTASLLCPASGFADEDCHPVLLTALDVRKAPKTAGMPLFAEVPKDWDAAESIYGQLPYDIGWVMKMPGGDCAMIYYFSTGELCIHALPSETAAEQFENTCAPTLLDLGSAVYPSVRVVRDAPDAALTNYVVFLPFAVDAAYTKRNQAE